jgi:enamine deaminase RidA (YjgF/YER057c/UK114 family)
VAVADVAGQAEQVMANLRVALDAADARLEDVVKTTVYVASDDETDLLAAWEVVSRHFCDHDPALSSAWRLWAIASNSSR